jgi:hypothetical protein
MDAESAVGCCIVDDPGNLREKIHEEPEKALGVFNGRF